MLASEPGCKNYIIFCQDPEITAAKFGHEINTKVFIVTIGSSWQIREFFNGKVAQNILNLLVASAGPALQEKNKEVSIYLKYDAICITYILYIIGTLLYYNEHK